VSLEGTLETIALPDVLALLSVTSKTGELRVEAGGGVGSIWFDAGQIAGYDVGNHNTVVDALFALLRLRQGNFKFHTGTQPTHPVALQDVSPVMDEAEGRLAQWPAIAAAVPSLSCELRLQPSVEGTVMLRPDQWQLVAAVGGGAAVGDVLSARGLGEFDGCKALKELVDLRLVAVGPADGPAPVRPALNPRATSHTADLSDKAEVAADRRVDPGAGRAQGAGQGYGTSDDDAMMPEADEVAEVADLSEVWDDETGDVEAAGPEEQVEESQDPVNRGLLLKFLGSARN